MQRDTGCTCIIVNDRLVTKENLCFNTEYELIIGNIPGAKYFCAQDKLTETSCIITGDNQITSNISNDNSIHARLVDSRNRIPHLEMGFHEALYEENKPIKSYLN